jgi:hypothetical protein
VRLLPGGDAAVGRANRRDPVMPPHLPGGNPGRGRPGRPQGLRSRGPCEAGAPSSPDWYYNLAAAGDGSVERGTETYKVTVRELTGAERDRVYAEQARRYQGFADYERQTAGVHTIPVLELRRA